MKQVLLTIIEPTTATLLIALGVGLGIAVHPVFFVATMLIAIAALIQSLINAAGHLTHRHPEIAGQEMRGNSQLLQSGSS